MGILQWYLRKGYDRYEDHNDHRDRVRIAFGDEDVRSHLIVNLLTEHDVSRDSNGKIKKILQILLDEWLRRSLLAMLTVNMNV